MKWVLHSVLRPAFEFAIFGNGFIALCATVMCHTTAYLFSLALPASFLPFIFCSTLASYSFHWYLTDTSGSVSERSRWNQRHKGAMLWIALAAGMLALGLLVRLQHYVPYLLPIVVMTFLYTAPKIDAYPFRYLRHVAILKTTYLALVWAYTTTALPLIMEAPAWQPAMAGWVVNRFLLIFSICLWFDYRDRDEDRGSKWLTIVSRLTPRQVFHFAYVVAAGFFVTLPFLYQQGFSARTVACISAPMLLLLGTIRSSAGWESDYWYYVYLDGILIVAGILLAMVG
ncbi:UbiA prenyltransferase family protein [Spirosoma rigui]|uniref:hypothetical protein n=1 Tax=Spirosoma rigui TaxID=564064 RepID=UPI0009B1A72B|nr:hypothetical protein [Spirosoma rigui]